ncbi:MULTISPECIES: glycosyltransferase family 2 protein [unclassified Cedecea]|uniref:glycosyltransferase family 2 protein n=1 Tax=unclassified Cedecea TaxID=2649846 RepID=UPI003015ED3A
MYKNGIEITIAIPTYNRVDRVKKQLGRLLPQLSINDRVIISDNATPGDELRVIVESFHDDRIAIRQNKVNIGANANIIRCFEYADTEYLWLLSDDDEIVADALDIIRTTIVKYNADFYNFSTDLLSTSRENTLCNNIEEYIDSIGSGISNHLLISNNIYKIKSVLPYLTLAFWGAYINAQHLVPVFAALQHGATIFLSSDNIVKWGSPEKNGAGGWRFANLYNLLFLPDVISASKIRKKAIRSVMSSLPAPEKLLAQLAYYKIGTDDNEKIDSYARRILNIYAEYGSFSLKLRARMLKILIRFPTTYLNILNVVFKRIKNDTIYSYLQKGSFEFYI